MNERLYRTMCAIARAIIRILYPLQMEGMEHIPAQGAGILCLNHISLRDPVMVGVGIERVVRFMAKAELFKHKWLETFMLGVGAFPVKRGESDMGSLRTAIQIIRDGQVLGIFAQGHRDKSGDMPMESGVALLALRTKAPVIPARILGEYHMFRRTCVRIGAPVDLSDFTGRYDSTQLREATERIEQAVNRLTQQHDS